MSGATLIQSGITGAGKDAGDRERNREIIYKQNTNYGFRGIATAAGHVSFSFQWYEHTNKAT